jgi:hypothetical protein
MLKLQRRWSFWTAFTSTAVLGLAAVQCGFGNETPVGGGVAGASTNPTAATGGTGSSTAGSAAVGGTGVVPGGGSSATGGDTATGGTGTPTGGTGTGGTGTPGGTFKNYEYTGTWPTQPIEIATKPGNSAMKYTKVVINDRFLAESCAIADYNEDGLPDVSAGRRWYEQKAGNPPTFVEHTFRGGHDDLPRAGFGSPGSDPKVDEINAGVSDDWSDAPYDMDGDGHVDIINIANCDVAENLNPSPKPAPQPKATAYWYKNPGPATAATAEWQGYLMHGDVRLEQHGLVDVDGDGKPEIFGACKGCAPAETKGYYAGNWANPQMGWTYHPVTQHYTFPFNGTGWLHGQGFGDINKDGKSDLLERGGAWIKATDPTPNLTVCAAGNETTCGWVKTNFWDPANSQDQMGPSHMYAADIDGDGDNDVVSADWAHGNGLSWYEQTTPLTFVRHQFMGGPNDMAKYGVYFSEPHALQVMDMDGDGKPDVVTGKMRFAHPLGYGDPDPNGTPYVYVFKNNGGTDKEKMFTPIMVDNVLGVGRQLAVGHVNTDGIPDICVSTKLGLAVFLGQP